MESLVSDWREIETELDIFQKNHLDYVKKLEEVEKMKKSYLEKFQKFKKKLNTLNDSVASLEKTEKFQSDDQKRQLQSVKTKINENLNYMRQISDTFPRPNGMYLKTIIGSINVSILNKEEKWKYKEEYEKFKYAVTIVSMCFSFLLLFITRYRVLDASFSFLLVWYYCTLTIRESILLVNGSQIKGWWQAHHFIATVCTAILLIWPDGYCYHQFRQQFIWFSFYLSFVQLLQYYYQKGCLYRLRALGEKEDMDTTVEGFQSWMLRGLSFILPFLMIGYFWQFYNSYVLFNLIISNACSEWQVYALSTIFFILFAGNFLTTFKVIRKKYQITNNLHWLKYKYYDWKKLKSPSEKNQ